MATVHVHRSNEAWKDRFRSYTVVIDEQEAGKLKRGRSATFEVTPGPHEVYAKIDWARSPSVQLDLADEDVIHLGCGNNIDSGG